MNSTKIIYKGYFKVLWVAFRIFDCGMLPLVYPYFYGIYDIMLLHLALKAGLVSEALVTVLHQSTLFTQMGLITFYTACLR